MHKSFILYLFFIFSFLLFFTHCAQIVNPSGGPKDIAPPKAVKYIPDSAATNFNAKNIIIVFDEYIQLNDLQKQLIISPPMKHIPEVKVKGKNLLIELQDSLNKNTTYTFNFGNSILDYTESNIAENFQYVFSTGSFIDSLSFTGTVKNAVDKKTEKGILVMLYDNPNDSVPYKISPSYFTRTGADGSYKINHIRQGNYRAFALKETNGNYLYDAPDESIAFHDTLIKLHHNTSLDFLLFKELPQTIQLKKYYLADAGKIILAFNRPIESISITSLSSTALGKEFYEEINLTKDTVTYWYKYEDNDDTIRLQLSVNQKIIDTIDFCGGCAIKKTRGRGFTGNKLLITTNASKNTLFDLNTTLSLNFSAPVQQFKFENIILTEDTLSGNLISKESWQKQEGDAVRQCMFFPAPYRSGKLLWKENSTYRLLIPAGTFTDILKRTNDTLKIDFKTQEEKFYGTLRLDVKTKKTDSSYILQLLNEKEEIIKKEIFSETKTFAYSFLHPGKYQLRIIYDSNEDEKWTPGNYLLHQQPERVVYYPDKITIRSNWDLELDWKVE